MNYSSDKDLTHIWEKEASLSRLMNNADLLEKVCQIFVETTPQKLTELAESIAQNDTQKVRNLSHSLKGSSGDVGAVQLHRLFAEIEHESKNNAWESIKSHYEQVVSSYATFVDVLNNQSN